MNLEQQIFQEIFWLLQIKLGERFLHITLWCSKRALNQLAGSLSSGFDDFLTNLCDLCKTLTYLCLFYKTSTITVCLYQICIIPSIVYILSHLIFLLLRKLNKIIMLFLSELALKCQFIQISSFIAPRNGERNTMQLSMLVADQARNVMSFHHLPQHLNGCMNIELKF